jgi:mono/diheme cytochrome c family protein
MPDSFGGDADREIPSLEPNPMTDYQTEQFPLPTPGRLRRELRLPRPPWWMVVGLIGVMVATWLPLYLIYVERSTYSTLPKIHFIQDMDNQPAFRAQQTSALFADGRAARSVVEGTMARGHLKLDDSLFRGYRTIREGADERIEFVSTIPDSIAVDAQTVQRGKERFNIYCVVCHGAVGDGNGLVHQRALARKEAQWVPPTNLLTKVIRDQTSGQLFQSISDGVRNMPGYNTQVSVRDRWAIVVYLRELQASQPVAAPAKTAPPQNLKDGKQP